MVRGAVVWSDRMDNVLEDLRLRGKVPWKAVAVRTDDGHLVSKKDCQDRLKLLLSGRPRPVAASPASVEPNDKDGVEWLHKKKRLSFVQAQKALWYRELMKRGSMGASIKSCLASAESGGGGSNNGGLPMGGSYVDSAAQLELFVVRSMILHNEPDLLTVMDGVCGLGHTVRYLAGGDQLRAAQLEAALRIALNMLIANDKAKEAAAKVANGRAQKAA